jgi:D-cysteine desulfhydrase family pyridoxal phosphate-dependent enzyme
MPRLESLLKGPRLFVKRDDLTGVALGGNKIRQLEYILAEAKETKADYVITTCGIQSNWSRQTVAMAVKLGMKALLVLRTAQFKHAPRVYDGNILLDHIMGAEIKTIRMKISEDPKEILEEEAEKLRQEGHNPYVMGLEASVSPLATAAYVDAVRELANQSGTLGVGLDAIVVATGAGPTHAGLALGAKILEMKTRVLGINVGAYDSKWLRTTIERSSSEAARLLGSGKALVKGDVTIRDEYSGRDYGIPTRASIEATKLVARTEALILDPVYTSKAMAGLINMVEGGEFRKDENVCFVHTGGVPALFPYKEYFQPRSRGR